MEKILVVSPFRRDIYLYPHLHDFIEMLGEYFAVEYLAVPERGYFIKGIFHPVSLVKVAKILLGLHKFAGKRDRYRYTIAIDNLPYVLASRFVGGRVILFSHDFVSHDNVWRNAAVQRSIAGGTAHYLKENGKIIIQSSERYELFCRSVGLGDGNRLLPYYLPVSLREVNVVHQRMIQGIPVVMQIGGINSFRSGSDRLLAHYQSNSDRYKLFFHGYVSADMLRRIRASEFVPFCSSGMIPPGRLYQIVACCDIGFISYDGADANFYHMAKSSGQLAEYLRMGKPVVAAGRNSLSSYLEQEGIGVYIEDMDQLTEAVEKIVARYDDYSSRCIELFKREYALNGYMPSLVRWITEDVRWTS